MVSRPIASDSSSASGCPGEKHVGVKVETKEGHSYLIHNPGLGSGGKSAGQTVVTDAKNMSEKWKVERNIPVGSGEKTM